MPSSVVTPMSWSTPTTTPNIVSSNIHTPSDNIRDSPSDVSKVKGSDVYSTSKKNKSRVSLYCLCFCKCIYIFFRLIIQDVSPNNKKISESSSDVIDRKDVKKTSKDDGGSGSIDNKNVDLDTR
jgi:hypothetical protein